jgi:hypothetical protein
MRLLPTQLNAGPLMAWMKAKGSKRRQIVACRTHAIKVNEGSPTLKRVVSHSVAILNDNDEFVFECHSILFNMH